MLDLCRTVITDQFHAALATIDSCIDRCPDTLWHAPIVSLEFNQAVFHTLFYADVYLGIGLDGFREQPFHRDNAAAFADYEELEDRAQRNRYERPFLKAYTLHCRDKAASVIGGETAETLAGPSSFDHLPFTRAELHLYNLRHIQHHAAQCIMRLRLDAKENMRWFRSGWPA